jgi:hypothetical protein
MKLYIMCGHGHGDSGAVGYGYKEQERVRALGKVMDKLGGANTVLLDTSRDWYAQGWDKLPSIAKGDQLIELHLDSGVPSAKGGHVIIASGLKADKYDNALASFEEKMFPGRSAMITPRSDLANPKRAKAKGISYRLLEVCFISNKADLTKFNKEINEIAKGILKCFGIGASTSAPSKPSTPSKPSKPATPAKPTFKAYKAQVTAQSGLNVRKGPGTSYGIVTAVRKGEVYTIVGEKNGFGKLKSGAGYVSLKYMRKI